MKTLNAEEAAVFLKMSAYSVRAKASRGDIPGRKTGKRWVFIEEHLADWVSGRYPEKRELRVIDSKKSEVIQKCQSTSVMKRGGLKSPQKMDEKYSSLLGLR